MVDIVGFREGLIVVALAQAIAASAATAGTCQRPRCRATRERPFIDGLPSGAIRARLGDGK
ncbi:MAG: hypothetical protein ABI854_05330 [Betaproteobacteria bacterium]